MLKEAETILKKIDSYAKVIYEHLFGGNSYIHVSYVYL